MLSADTVQSQGGGVVAPGFDGSVPKEYVRAVDPQLLPPRVGHNWNDQAFRKNQDKPQQLEGEFRGKRAFVSTTGNYDNAPPEGLGETAHQLMAALSQSQRGNLRKSTMSNGAGTKRLVTLDDKVLRFYAFFSERAPEGGANEYWHRKVVIFFYPADDTVLIQEPPIPNSGLDGGTYLKRQKVKADPRQREQFPGDEYVSLNFFNVGQSVRLNAVDFFLYDCDPFTRDFLTSLGVEVGESVECPDDEFMLAYKRHLEKMQSAKFGILSHDYGSDDAERAARFVRDGGTVVRFFALLDERARVPGGAVRRLEVLLFVEDGTIAIVERQSTVEANPALFLSRGWLPKSGSLERANELTFRHRVNGQREPDIGADGFYKDADLYVGATINVLGRPVFLYDCDDFTREFYKERLGVVQGDAVDVTDCFAAQDRERTASLRHRVTAKANTLAGSSRSDASTGETQRQRGVGGNGQSEVYRFRMHLAEPKTHDDKLRQFVLAYYTESNEVAVHEKPAASVGIPGGCLLKRQPLRRPPPPSLPRNAPVSLPSGDRSEFYTKEEFGVGKEIVVSGMRMKIVGMDEHTEALLTQREQPPPAQEQVVRMLGNLREYLWSRYGSAKNSFLALDHNRDGSVGLDEFTAAMKSFQITQQPAVASALFCGIASSTDTAYLTTEDVMKWMDEEESKGTLRGNATADGAAEQQRELDARSLRTRVLGELRSRLDARCMNSAEMFRLASTMPRAYPGRRADVHSLSNPARDAMITPVQLRRCVTEILGGLPTPEEMSCILSFFFPQMPSEAHPRRRDDEADFFVELPEFQRRYNEMCQLGTLTDDHGEPSQANMKTSII